MTKKIELELDLFLTWAHLRGSVFTILKEMLFPQAKDVPPYVLVIIKEFTT